MDPVTIATAFIPVITDGIRGLINKFTGGAATKPANVEEAIKLVDADVRRLEALAKIDSVGQVSTWVNNIRAMMRPTMALLIVAMFGFSMTMVTPVDDVIGNLCSAVVFYLFGDRTYMHFKRQA